MARAYRDGVVSPVLVQRYVAAMESGHSGHSRTLEAWDGMCQPFSKAE